MIEINDLSLKFKDRCLLDHQDVFIPDGKITLFTGESGCGKSTLLFELAGLTDYSHCNQKRKDSKWLKKDVSFVYQDCRLFEDFTVIQNIMMYEDIGENEHDESFMMELVDELNLNIDLQGPVKNLSGGEKQRLILLCCMMKKTKMIFMDEPTAYLDEKNRQELIAIIKKLSCQYRKTIVIASHDISLVAVCDRHYHFENQKLILKKEEGHIETDIYERASVKTDPVGNYLKIMRHNKTYIRKGIIIILLVIMTTYLTCFSSYYKSAVDDMINRAMNNELRLSNAPGSHPYNEYEKPISRTLINQLKTTSVIKSIHPFYQWEFKNLDGTTCVVQPYYSYQKLESKTDYTCQFSIDGQRYDGKVYVSSSLGKNKNMKNIRGDMHIYDGKKINDISMEIDAVNILNDSIKNRYTKSGEDIIYLPETVCLNILSHRGIDDLSNMHLIEINSYSDASEVERIVKQKDSQLFVYNPVDRDVLTSISSFSNELMNRFSSIIDLVFMVSIILIQVMETLNRRYEYAIMQCNGIERKECLHLIFRQKLRFSAVMSVLSFIAVNGMSVIRIHEISSQFMLESIYRILTVDLIMIVVPIICFLFINIIKKPGELLKNS